MPYFQWLRSRARSSSNRRRPNRAARFAAAAIESLERRMLLTYVIAPEEQLFVYELNRARHDPEAYEEEQNLSVDLSYVDPQPALAVNQDLFESARFHSVEMATYNYFGHQSQVTGDWPNKMARDAGYELPGYFDNNANYIESLAAGTYFNTAIVPLNALIVDEGVPSLGHRKHLLGIGDFYEDSREIGVGYDSSPSATYTNYWTIHATFSDVSDQFLTGVVFDDLNNNDRYDLNEGLSGISITAGVFTTTTNSEGGWSIQVPDGTYEVQASGAGFTGQGSVTVDATGANIEVDFISGLSTGWVDFELVENEASPPATPANFTATTTGVAQVTLDWDPVADATSYNLYRYNLVTKAFQQIYTGTNTDWVDSGSHLNTSYGFDYAVTATNVEGTSPVSLIRYTPPAAATPTGVSAQVTGPESIRISWNAVGNATSYTLYRYNTATQDFQQVYNGSNLQFVDSGSHLTPGVYFDYAVRAHNLNGSSSATVVRVRISTVSAPDTFTARLTAAQQVTATWSAVAGASSYQLYRYNTATQDFQKIYDGTALSFVDSGPHLTTDTNFDYAIVARSGSATSPVLTRRVLIKVPATPANVVVQLTGAMSVAGSWDAVAGATGYQVARYNTETQQLTVIYTGTSRQFTDSGSHLTSNTIFDYAVNALNGTVLSPATIKRINTTAPVAPASLTATKLGAMSYRLDWTAVTAATSYQLYRYNTSTRDFQLIYNGTSRQYTDSGSHLTANTIFDYAVVALNGTVKSAATVKRVNTTSPAAPQSFTATRLTSTSYRLDWSAVTGATGYRVARYNASTGDYQIIYTGTNLQYTDTGAHLTPGTTFYYAVVALNGSTASPANMISITTDPASSVQLATSLPDPDTFDEIDSLFALSDEESQLWA